MATTSATGGYLVPAASPAPLEGQSLDQFLQQVVVGITGLPGNLVRPRWQQTTPNLPAKGTDWAALGITDRDPDTFAATVHTDDATGGYDTLYRHESLQVLTSFYGPNAGSYAGILSDGLQLPQNLEVLTTNKMGLVSTGSPRQVPELIKNQWVRRFDLQVIINRQIVRAYPILTLLSADGTVVTDSGQTETISTP